VVDQKQKLVGIITESDIFELVVLNEWQIEVSENA
jgi:CBS domain-containing protein